jgi:4a-hydroxytetrahydrobiopterin dehydratase
VDGGLEQELEFASFPEAIAFVERLAEVAEAENHHPDIDIRYRRVRVRWTTHSAGGITDRDRELAVRTDELL